MIEYIIGAIKFVLCLISGDKWEVNKVWDTKIIAACHCGATWKLNYLKEKASYIQFLLSHPSKQGVESKLTNSVVRPFQLSLIGATDRQLKKELAEIWKSL